MAARRLIALAVAILTLGVVGCAPSTGGSTRIDVIARSGCLSLTGDCPAHPGRKCHADHPAHDCADGSPDPVLEAQPEFPPGRWPVGSRWSRG